MTSFDTYREMFLALLKKGYSHAESMAEFSREELHAAMRSEIESHTTTYNPETCRFESPCGNPSLLDMIATATREERNADDMEKAYALWMAGWTSELPSKTTTEVMSWYWRRPSRRSGKPGRRYLSTDQALNALRKEQGK